MGEMCNECGFGEMKGVRCMDLKAGLGAIRRGECVVDAFGIWVALGRVQFFVSLTLDSGVGWRLDSGVDSGVEPGLGSELYICFVACITS
jgi:hypothetical protein